MTKIKAVIFDMDGVLIDAKDWHYEALNQALDLFGYKISRYDHLVTFDGLPTKKNETDLYNGTCLYEMQTAFLPPVCSFQAKNRRLRAGTCIKFCESNH